MRVLLLLTIAISCLDATEAAEVHFMNTMVRIENTSRQDIVKVDFRGKNSTNFPLVIRSVEKSCGCVQVAFPQRPVRPNGSFVIIASIKITKQNDQHNVHLLADIFDQKEHLIPLDAEIDTPSAVSVDVNSVSWNAREEHCYKVVKFTSSDGEAIKNVRMDSVASAILASLVEVSPREWDLVVRPMADVVEFKQAINVYCELDGGQIETKNVVVHVMPAT
jgi:hypothetical protein